MGKDKKKKGIKANVFKVAGAKSLKKTKAKAVHLGLKNINQKIAEVDKQLVEIKNNPNTKTIVELNVKKPEKEVSKEEVAKTAVEINKLYV